MQHEFWHERWQQNQIGFHSEIVHPYLQQFWPTLNVPGESRVFVPLCGKSRDMLWLKAQGLEVVGVELSPLAVAAFFTENALPVSTNANGQFNVSECEGLRLYCGSFFDLRQDHLSDVSAVYDRAALVALPPDLRAAYATHLRQLLASGTTILLVSFDYAQHEMLGPPFSVPRSELELLFGDWCNIELLAAQDILAQEARFREKGLTQLLEQVYILTVR